MTSRLQAFLVFVAVVTASIAALIIGNAFDMRYYAPHANFYCNGTTGVYGPSDRPVLNPYDPLCTPKEFNG